MDSNTVTAQVTDAQLARYAGLIYAQTGVRISPQKRMLLSNRIRRRLRENGMPDFDVYFRHLSALNPSDPEWHAFLQEITTHETYLFRDEGHWDWFRDEFLPRHAAAAKTASARSLRIWSAACSTGDEACTAACLVAAHLPNLDTWRVRIVGTDIGLGAIEQARSGVFNERQMRLVNDKYKTAYFRKFSNCDIWQAKPVLMQMMQFRQHNLLHPLREQPFDLVILKNVLIYFDFHSKRQVLSQLQPLVRTGGYLVSGAAEGVTELLHDGMQRQKPWLHWHAAPKSIAPSPIDPRYSI